MSYVGSVQDASDRTREVTMEEREGVLAGEREEEETRVFGGLFTVLLAVAFAEVG